MYQLIVNPLFQYALLAAGMAMCLYLFVSLKMELRALHKGPTAEIPQAALETRVKEIGERVEEALAQAWTPQIRPAGINYTKRTQALRMNRRGDSAATIAGALAVPRREVELLLKVQKLIQR